MMPDLDGFEVLRLVRRQSQVPVIMLTARTTQADRVAGLDAGADDYLPKPFGTEELLARIRAVLRRAGRAPKEPEVLEAGGIRLIPSAREALLRRVGRRVDHGRVRHPRVPRPRRGPGRLARRADGRPLPPQGDTFRPCLDMHICNLRKKLGGHGDLIRTVRSVGYLFRSGPEADGGP